MKDKIFLIWSGSNVVATKVKHIVEVEKNNNIHAFIKSIEDQRKKLER